MSRMVQPRRVRQAPGPQPTSSLKYLQMQYTLHLARIKLYSKQWRSLCSSHGFTSRSRATQRLIHKGLIYEPKTKLAEITHTAMSLTAVTQLLMNTGKANNDAFLGVFAVTDTSRLKCFAGHFICCATSLSTPL